MNWDAIGAIGEVIGALAVVVTLVFLIFQLRQNTSAQQAAVEQQIASGFSESLRAVADSEIPRIWAAATSSFDKLDETEKTKYAFFLFSYLKQFEHAYIQYEMGNLSEVTWKAVDRTLRESVLISDGALRYWDLRQNAYHEGFRNYVNEIPRTDAAESLKKAIDFVGGNRTPSAT